MWRQPRAPTRMEFDWTPTHMGTVVSIERLGDDEPLGVFVLGHFANEFLLRFS